MQKQPSKGFFKKVVMRNFTEFTKNICARISFMIKLNSADLHLHESKSLAQVFSGEVLQNL